MFLSRGSKNLSFLARNSSFPYSFLMSILKAYHLKLRCTPAQARALRRVSGGLRWRSLLLKDSSVGILSLQAGEDVK